jgi:hypothetical protein
MGASWDVIQGLVDGPTALAALALLLIFAAYGARRMRALVVFIAQYAAFLALALSAAIAGRHGYTLGLAYGQAQGLNDTGQLYYGVGGAAALGLLGFIAGGLVLAVFFVLLEIRQNTRG